MSEGSCLRSGEAVEVSGGGSVLSTVRFGRIWLVVFDDRQRLSL